MDVGAGIVSKRWHRWLWDGKITCASGHPIPGLASIEETGAMRCSKWIEAEGRWCGKWIWLTHFRGGGNLVIEVTVEEMKRLKNLDTPSRRLAYLGIFEEVA